MGHVSQQQDMFDKQIALNAKTGNILGQMKSLAEQAQNTNSSEELQKIQIKLADLQRDLDVMKQIEEKIAKAMESINKFVQAQYATISTQLGGRQLAGTPASFWACAPARPRDRPVQTGYDAASDGYRGDMCGPRPAEGAPG